MIAILHNIRSVHNVGSIFRTADAAGFETIYLTGITPMPIDRFGSVRAGFAKVSLGAERNLAWKHMSSLGRLIVQLQKHRVCVYAVEQDTRAVPYYRARGGPRAALLMGNEVRGLSGATLAQCDKILEIPMYGTKESLNVAVAFGIVAYHFIYA